MRERILHRGVTNRTPSEGNPRGSPLAPRGSQLVVPRAASVRSTLHSQWPCPAKPSSSTRSRCMAQPLSEKRSLTSASCSAFKINHLRCSWCMMVDLVLVLKTIAAATPRLQQPAEISRDSCQLRLRSDKRCLANLLTYGRPLSRAFRARDRGLYLRA